MKDRVSHGKEPVDYEQINLQAQTLLLNKKKEIEHLCELKHQQALNALEMPKSFGTVEKYKLERQVRILKETQTIA
jgi:hypothetical protein